MKRFLIRLSWFLIPIIILVICLEYTFHRLPNGYNIKKHLIETQAKHIEVLVLGSSHALRAINPTYFSKSCINMSYVSQPLYYDAAITYQYLPIMKNLKYVIISLSYFSLDYTLMDSPEHWRDYFYYQYYGFRYPEISRTNPHLYSSILLYEAPSLYIWFKENYRTNFSNTLNNNGWIFTDTAAGVLTNNEGMQRVAKHLSTIHSKRRVENLSILCKLVDTLQKRNIKVILISTPMHKTYIENTDKVYLANWTRIIDSITTIYKMPFYNYMADNRFLDNDFMNCDHLNARGAKKFSIILNKDIFAKDTTIKEY